MELGLLLLLGAGPVYGIAVGAWIASGTTPVRAGIGLVLALLGGVVGTLAFEWFVGSRERDVLIVGTGEWLTLAAAAVCLVIAACLHGVMVWATDT